VVVAGIVVVVFIEVDIVDDVGDGDDVIVGDVGVPADAWVVDPVVSLESKTVPIMATVTATTVIAPTTARQPIANFFIGQAPQPQ